MSEPVFNPDDFPPKYKADMLGAYPGIAQMNSEEAWMATHSQRERAFTRILAAKNLRVTHQQYLDELNPPPSPADLTRDDLIELCTDGVVPQSEWRDRDTASAQIQLGKARALLAAGCDFRVITSGETTVSDDKTIWVDITWKGFAVFDYGGDWDDHTFYIPSRRSLNRAAGGDWY